LNDGIVQMLRTIKSLALCSVNHVFTPSGPLSRIEIKSTGCGSSSFWRVPPVLVTNRGSGYPSCPRTQPQGVSAGAIAPASFFMSASG